MKPEKSPKACRVQTYSPPSCGYRDESSSTLAANGRKKPNRAKIQRRIALGPAAAAVAIQRRLRPLTK